MLIDWFTVGAQIVNFVILIWLMKRFLFGPILNAVDAREQLIAAELAGANAKAAEARAAGLELERKNSAFDAERAALLAAAVAEAQTERARLQLSMQKEASDARAQQLASTRRERIGLGDELKRAVTAEVFEVVRKALCDMAAVTLEERMVEIFTRRLRTMDAKPKMQLGAAFADSREAAVVRSGFDLPDRDRAILQNAFNETFSTAVRLEFVVSPATICGIEVAVGGQKLGWSLAGYLTTLEQEVGQALDASQTSDSNAVPNPVEMGAARRSIPALTPALAAVP